MMRMWSLGFLAVLSACHSEGQPEDSRVFSQTIVALHGSDPPTVTTRSITAAQQRTEVEARKGRLATRSGKSGVISQAISQDGGCSDASLLLFDDYRLSCNELCFFGAGSVWLHDYPRLLQPHDGAPNTTVDWAEAVMSYWPGDEDGIFFGAYLRRGRCQSSFAGIGDTLPVPVDFADGCVRSSIQLQLTD
jgi:hypothetical protein